MSTLSEFHSVVGPIIFEFDATLERFTGDGLMCFLGAPSPEARHASKAVDMAKLIPSISHLFLVSLESAESILTIISSISWVKVSYLAQFGLLSARFMLERNSSIFFKDWSFLVCSSPSVSRAKGEKRKLLRKSF